MGFSYQSHSSSPRCHKSIPVKVTIPGNWKHILTVRNDLLKEDYDMDKVLVPKVGDGICIYFWKDLWVGNETLMLKYPGLFALDKNKNCKVGDRGKTKNGEKKWSWDWRRNRLSSQEEQELKNLVSQTQNVSFSQEGDRWKWMDEGDGLFSTKSLRISLDNNRSQVDMYPLEWHRWIPLNVISYIWRARLNRIPNNVLLQQSSVHLELVECSMCFGMEEDTNHVLVKCLFAQKVWNSIGAWCGLDISDNMDFRELVDSPLSLIQPSSSKRVIYSIFMSTGWAIWKLGMILFLMGLDSRRTRWWIW